MKDSSPLLSLWHGEVKQLFSSLHGHQQKVLSLFVLGAMRAESIVLSRVAEELLSECEANVPSIERRLQRFVSNERIEVVNWVNIRTKMSVDGLCVRRFTQNFHG